MKAMKKLIPAICLLLISAVLLGTSTYAWFSMNKTVTATGMQVKATTPASVEISQDHTTWAYTTAFTADAKILTPTFYNSADKKFYIPTSANAINADGSPSTAFNSTDTANWQALTLDNDGKADNIQYLSVYTLYVRTNVGATTEGVTAVELTCSAAKEGDSKLKDGVSVGIMNDDGTVVELSATASSQTWTAALSSNTTTPYTAIKVVIWYNGSNTAVKNDNADTVATKINLTFQAKEGA